MAWSARWRRAGGRSGAAEPVASRSPAHVPGPPGGALPMLAGPI